MRWFAWPSKPPPGFAIAAAFNCGNILDTPPAQLRMFCMRADVFSMMPAAHALLRATHGCGYIDVCTFQFGQYRLRRLRAAIQPQIGDDEEEAQLIGDFAVALDDRLVRMNHDVRIQRRADLAILAHAFQHARAGFADAQQVAPPAALLECVLRRSRSEEHTS